MILSPSPLDPIIKYASRGAGGRPSVDLTDSSISFRGCDEGVDVLDRTRTAPSSKMDTSVLAKRGKSHFRSVCARLLWGFRIGADSICDSARGVSNFIWVFEMRIQQAE